MKEVRWIGLAKVTAVNSDILGDKRSAFVNALAFANSKLDFRKKVKNKLTQMGLKLIRLEEAEPLKDRLSKFHVDKELLELSKRLGSEGSVVEFSTFHTYD